ncbi:MAG: DNA polymerase domain-containing protein, partial [Candidatus Asgardarchaeia archaeon]
MKVQFQILDVDYNIVNSKPVIRLFGRTNKNESITVFYDGFLPYFYVLPVEGKFAEVKERIKKDFKEFIVAIERTKKYPPIGFRKEPIELLKVVLNDPSKTPLVRDGLKSLRIVKDVYEADILFRYRFMADHEIFGMRWYEVEGEPIRTSTVKTKKKIKAVSFREIKKEENMRFKYMSIDIETLSGEGGLPDAEKDPIILISMSFYPSFRNRNSLVLAAKPVKKFDDDVMGFPSEREMLLEFVRIMDQFDCDFICGYNITNFDLPYIEMRLRKNNIPRTLGRCTQKAMRCSKFANKNRITIPGRVVVDVYSMIKEATRKFGLYKGLKRYGLGDVSKLILGEDKVDVAHSEINGRWMDNGERLKKLIEYNRKDAELPLRILMKQRMLDKFLEICKVTGIVLQDALDSGEAARVENLLLREFNKSGFVIPCKPDSDEVARRTMERRERGLKGAFVLRPDVGFHDNCVVYLDFRSMYPSIFINLNICPTTLLLDDKDVECNKTPSGSRFVAPEVRRGIFPRILQHLLETRDKIKREMKATDDKKRFNYLYAKQYAFKTIANAFYGYSGYIRARFYVLDIANAITSTGREMIKRTKKVVETKTSYRIVYGDTDSIMVKLDTKDVEEAFKKGKEIAELVNNEVKILRMKIESIFKTLIILAKKRYAGWSFEPKN